MHFLLNYTFSNFHENNNLIKKNILFIITILLLLPFKIRNTLSSSYSYRYTCCIGLIVLILR